MLAEDVGIPLEAGSQVVMQVHYNLLAGEAPDVTATRLRLADGDADLAELDLPALGIEEPFDAIVSAGNVMAFLAPGTRVAVLRRLRAHVAPDGRAVVGFGAGRGYAFDDFRDDARAAGWAEDLLLSTWDLRPFTPESDFLVAVLRPA